MKFYRKQPIEAEQFDGSDAMVDKYELIDAGTMLGTHHSPELYLTGSGKVDVGDWIATGVNGERWLITDEVFKKTYAELPVIPKAVADYMNDYNNLINLSFHSALYEAFDDLFAASQDVEHWIEHNSDVFARAWLDGYQVEEEK
ncbi:hypothetical protein AYO51_15420 [Lactiplantibacillus plantarum]|uniref:DUF1642 domain-containing protein n=1 Tax=Lactiplantibacillus plantarum TaxID=1590 RepID=UPI000787776F|nr:DUF1642 domain-containing protein [Lactiplantibacillus plantarum]KYK53504.1 hypothetical protein AYO51_15420 [Lactiplantibacillus plantarum]KYM70795.1 hypothetical protein AZJ01_17105 [Lactiplantibacillus plantarum]